MEISRIRSSVMNWVGSRIMKRFLVAIAVALAVVSCNKSDNEPTTPTLKTIYASTSTGAMRTWMDTAGSHYWSVGDVIGVGDGNSTTAFTLTDGADTAFGEFTGLASATGGYAVFPASSNTISDAGEFSVTFPATQTFTAENFRSGCYAQGANVLVATGGDANGYSFKNAGGFLAIKLTGDDGVIVRNIIIESASTIAGSATVMYNGDVAAMSTAMGSGSQKITMNCYTNSVVDGVHKVDGVALNKTTPTMFVVAMPAVTMEGMTVRVVMTNDSYIEKATAKSIEIKRNVLLPMATIHIANITSGGGSEGGDEGGSEGGEGGSEGGTEGGEGGTEGGEEGGEDTPPAPTVDVTDISNTVWYIVAEGDGPIDPSHIKIGENNYAYPLTAGESITTLNPSMVPSGSNVSIVVVPETVENIENKTFHNLTDGFALYLRSTTPPDLGNMPTIKTSDVGTIYVPAGTLDLSRQDADWGKLESKGIVFEEYTEIEGA